jgi:Tol biopolymer transport system component
MVLVAGIAIPSQAKERWIHHARRDDLIGDPATDGDSSAPSLSLDGSTVAFVSDANLLVASFLTGAVNPDVNAEDNIWVDDGSENILVTYDYELNEPSNGPSLSPSITPDGRYVVYASDASNLIGDENDSNGVRDIFRFDVLSGVSIRVSVKSNGNAANGDSFAPSISNDGRYVAFSSDATNIGTDSNGKRDVFVRDVVGGSTVRVSVSSSGTQGTNASNAPDISGDGAVVGFHSAANNLVTSDSNGVADVFVYTRATAQTKRVSLTSSDGELDGKSQSPALSIDGKVVAFESESENMSGDNNNVQDIFVRDRNAGSTTRVSRVGSIESDDLSWGADISSDGKYVVFASDSDSWGGRGVGDCDCTDVWEANRLDTSILKRLSVPSSEDPAQAAALNADSVDPTISPDGIVAAFATLASNLLTPPELNGHKDIYTHEWEDTNDRTGCTSTLRTRLLRLLTALLFARIAWNSPEGGGCDDPFTLAAPDFTKNPALPHQTFALTDDTFNHAGLPTAYLRWGTEAWGYNHIAPKHGWSTVELGIAQSAVSDPDLIEEEGGSFEFYKAFGSTAWEQDCVMRVVISYLPKPVTGPTGGIPYHVITAYSHLGTSYDF